ncbi:13170_t:CDS:1, partial [Dentiscutata heterogama]
NGTQDLLDWSNEFDYTTKANYCSKARQFELAKAYIKDIADE